MAVTVIQTNANHYKAHRILVPEGSSFVYNNKEVTVGTRVYGDDTSAAPTIIRVTSASIVAENPGDVKFSPRDAADDKAYAEEAKAHFGKTYRYNKAGYIVTDGSMLDFSGKGSRGDGLNVQAPEGAIPFEEYAFADEFADDGDVKFSKRYVDGEPVVWVEDNILANKPTEQK